jgi:hypothetical protein
MLFANLNPWTDRFRDDGPIYAETIRYEELQLSGLIVEPWNAATAMAFVAIVVAWVIRLRGRFRQHPFLMICLPLLLLGGVGGTLYHGLRRSSFFLVMDVLPIVFLVLAGSVYLWIRMRPPKWVVPSLIGIFAIGSALSWVFKSHVAINIQYVMLAVSVIVPVVIVLVKMKFRHIGLIRWTLITFGFAILFRFLDPLRPPILPMGTHWLWHLGGAAATQFLAEYFYRLEREEIPRLTFGSAAA